MKFALFLLVNAMLFIRPAEFYPELYGLPVYEVCIVACLGASYPLVVAQLMPERLAVRPVNACAAALLPVIVLSLAARGDFAAALEAGSSFAKVLLYYFLLVSLVDTPARLGRFLTALGVFALAITVIAVLHYHGAITLPTVEVVRSGIDDSGDEESMVRRLGATGLFGDPNDLSLLLVMAMTVCLYQVVELRRWYWLAALGFFGHALLLTHSRGGFLAMLLSLCVYLAVRVGRRALPVAALLLPAVFLLFAGRQTDLGSAMRGGGTALSRLELWRDGLDLFVHAPLLGVGADRYAELVGHVAHNSFIHSFVELGLAGGTLFLAAFYLAVTTLVRLGGRDVPPALLGDELTRLRPYVLTVVAGYAGGLMSLSCPYTIPTYTVLGLASTYAALAEERLGVTVSRVSAALLQNVAVVAAAFVVVAVVGVRVLTRNG